MPQPITTFCQSLALFRKSVPIKNYLCVSHGSLIALHSQKKGFLHPSENLYFSTLAHEKRQHSYLLGRYCVKQALAMYTDVRTLECFHIDHGIFGQPIVYHPGPDNIQTSISHCEQIAIAIIFPETHPIGIDLEKIDNKNTAAIQNQLTDKELNLLSSFSTSTQLSLLLTVFWSAKEALSKILRTGLMASFEALSIQYLQQEEASWICEFQHFAQYQVHSLLLGDYIFSIVLPKKTSLHIDIDLCQKMQNVIRASHL